MAVEHAGVARLSMKQKVYLRCDRKHIMSNRVGATKGCLDPVWFDAGRLSGSSLPLLWPFDAGGVRENAKKK